jgi:hypothetical protein
MWSNDIRQIVELFQSRVHVQKVINDPVEYVKVFERMLRALGPELKFLQLAVPDKKSPFGWKPTPRLMQFIAKRKHHRKKSKPSYAADTMWYLLSDYALGYGNAPKPGHGNVLTRQLLLAVGLIRKIGDTDWVTEAFHYLFNESYYNKLDEDGLRRRNITSTFPV